MPRWPRSPAPIVHRVLPYAPGSKVRRRWKRLVLRMGPEPNILPKASIRTLDALQRHGVLVYERGEDIVVGYLTPLGITLRDRWIQLAARKYEKRVRAQINAEK